MIYIILIISFIGLQFSKKGYKLDSNTELNLKILLKHNHSSFLHNLQNIKYTANLVIVFII